MQIAPTIILVTIMYDYIRAHPDELCFAGRASKYISDVLSEFALFLGIYLGHCLLKWRMVGVWKRLIYGVKVHLKSKT